MKKVATTRISGGVEYAKVADRLQEFRSSNPRSKITIKTSETDSGIYSRAYIWKDNEIFIELLKGGVKAEDALESADADGSSFMTAEALRDRKGYEKNETIAVGRALALLGYAMSGEIASSEEMEEFEAFKERKQAEKAKQAITKLQVAETIQDLAKAWQELDKSEQIIPKVREFKDKRKSELSK